MAFQSKYGDEKSFNSGDLAEIRFVKVVKETGWECEEAPKRLQFKHIDFLIKTESGKEFSVEVKARKRKRRSDKNFNDDLIFIEFKNVAGYDGWLYGAADIIAFEREEGFILVNREDLKNKCLELCDLSKKATQPTLYQSYTRLERKDVVSMIKFEDIASLKTLFLIDKK